MPETASTGKHRAESKPPAEATIAVPPKEQKKRKRMDPLLRFLIKLALVAGITAAVLHFVLGIHIHHGNRMYPALCDGDLLISYKLDPYHTGDAVLYRVPGTGEIAVSRIVAVGESEIAFTEYGELQINGFLSSEQVFSPTYPAEDSAISYPYRMSADGFFLLDDHRVIGRDSRDFGELREEDILGKIVYVLRRRGI